MCYYHVRQPLGSLVASPISSSDSTGTGVRPIIETPPKVLRGLWGKRPVENVTEEGKDAGLFGRELAPYESRGQVKRSVDINTGDDNFASSAGESASVSACVSAPGSDATGAAEGGDTANLFFSREPGRRRQVVFDPLSPSRHATPFLLEAPHTYISGRRLASVPNVQSTGAKPGGGNVFESPDRGGRSDGGEGELPWSFYSAGLSATSFFSSPAKTHETTRRISTSGYLSSVDSLCRCGHPATTESILFDLRLDERERRCRKDLKHVSPRFAGSVSVAHFGNL